ncbi:uncharacterized protein LOC116253819 [Nymphaea colorata]|nr:uncharacterized protein LOC116253819 [Nymphaea colorata]
MAEDLDDGEFWLPSRFLSEEMGFLETKLPCEFPYCDSSSPVESVVSSTETESDEEDYMAGLMRRMAHSTLEDDEKEAAQKVAVMAGSPQSTLCRSLDSSGSQGGSNGPSQVSSPPSTPLNQEDDAWDLLSAAAGQVVRMKMNEEGEKYQGRGLLGPPKQPVAVPVPVPAAAVVPKQTTQMKAADVSGYPLQRCWSDNGRDASALAMHFEFLKQQKQQQSNWGKQQQQQHQQAAKIAQAQQIQSRVRAAAAAASAKFGRPLGLPPSAWPPLQSASANTGLRAAPLQSPSANAGMRAVFLGNSSSRRESSGTGVFLPRRVGSSPDYRKKSGCSTVLLPARVVQALNLSIDDMGSAQPNYYLGSLVHDRDSSSLNMDPRPYIARNGLLPPQKRTVRPQQPVLNSELRLPQEWTY